MELTDTLVRVSAADPSAAQQWVRAIHAAFYAPVPRGSPVNKFLELETTLTQVLVTLSEQQVLLHAGEEDKDNAGDLWTFVVRVVLLLAQEPKAMDGASADSDASSKTIPFATPMQQISPQLVETISGNAAGETRDSTSAKAKKKNAQPYAPLAFVVVNALKKLAVDPEGEAAKHFLEQGKTNEELVAFCLRGLAHPEAVDQKLLVEIIDLFQLVHFDKALVLAASEHLVASKSYSAAIKLCAIFRDLDWPFAKMVKLMAQGKDWVSAELLVRSGSRPESEPALAKVLVEEAIAMQDFKRSNMLRPFDQAHRLVHNFNLQQDYPDIEMMYSRDGLMRLIEKQKWQIALSFVGNDTTLQKILFDHVVAAGEIAHAVYLAKCLGMTDYQPDLSQITAEGVAFAKGSSVSKTKYLSLPLESSAVTFCDHEQHIREATAFFFDRNEKESGSSFIGESSLGAPSESAPVFDSAELVGMDVEWKPTTSRASTRTIASILQIATSTRVFLIDLLMLHDNDYLFETFLPRLFSSEKYLKIGFGFDSDMKDEHGYFKGSRQISWKEPVKRSNSDPGQTTGQGSVMRHLRCSVGYVEPLPPEYLHLDATFVENATVKLGSSTAVSQSSAVRSIGRVLSGRDPDEAVSVDILARSEEEESSLIWQRVSDQIIRLKNPTVASAEAGSELTRLRHQYVAEWRQHLTQNRTMSANLLTPEDVFRCWEERKTAFLGELEEKEPAEISGSELEIKFLPAKSVSELLSQQHKAEKPRKFTHINSICFFADEIPHVACIDASSKLDTAELARVCGVGRRKVKLATPEECESVFGFLPGTVPPFGHRLKVDICEGAETPPSPIKVYADDSLTSAECFIGGGGSPDSYLWMSAKAFFNVIDVETVPNITLRRGSLGAGAMALSPTAAIAGKEQETNGRQTNVLAHKFVADTMASQVARWLRTIGVDVVTWNAEKHGDKNASNQTHRAKLLAFAAKERRIILTRDTQLASRRDAGACLVLSSDVCYKQFREIKTQFGMYARKEGSASRCARCNATEFVTIDVEYVRSQSREHIHAKVLGSVTSFWMCTECEKIYWEGPKYTSSVANSSDGEVLYQPVWRPRRNRKQG